MERLPPPASLLRLNISLKVGGSFSESELRLRLEELGYDLDDEPDYPGGALFHGQTFEIFPAGALGPFRVEHSGRAIRRIVAFDPKEHDIIFETKELLVDPMSERTAITGARAKRATLFDYCGKAKWIADAGVSVHADAWLSTIEEAAGRADREREYLGRPDWKQATRGMKVLPRNAPFQPTPEFSKLTSARKALRAYVEETQARRFAPDPRCGAGGRSARDGADERRAGGTRRGLGRGRERAPSRRGVAGRSRRRLRHSG